ncbi:PiggyBac transposable element-derived protein 4 [Pseudolycoriella hygida]|uniref:PiggyBac transposable element-derived protein 4 n=1 Tax=Pseudolycoriella hygida TaxID=35572 RepID=A0A9Q0NC91_9DIPT|nr:PiggyBac transposable element-derived protein 4 [Pseudolycoriella hygida]
MIKFKGRCVLKQYMPMKPIKRGYKVWCLADAVTGFILAFIVYTGKEKIITESTLGERVVMTFAQKLRPEKDCMLVER